MRQQAVLELRKIYTRAFVTPAVEHWFGVSLTVGVVSRTVGIVRVNTIMLYQWTVTIA